MGPLRALKLRTTAFSAAGLIGLVVALTTAISVPADERVRFVPQLELTDSSPRKVSFAPDDGVLLLVVNNHGRIDVLELSNPGRPVKIAEIFAGALDAAFVPMGTPRESKSNRFKRTWHGPRGVRAHGRRTLLASHFPANSQYFRGMEIGQEAALSHSCRVSGSTERFERAKEIRPLPKDGGEWR